MDNVRRVFLLTGLGVTLFATGVLGGLGADAAGRAAGAAKRAERAVGEADKQSASIEETAAILSAVFYFGSLVAFAIVIMYATYR
jgi:hypothetical protein